MRPGQRGRDLMQIAAAVVGTAAAAQVIPVYTHSHDGKLCAEKHAPEVTHYIVRGLGVTSCCARSPFDLPITDRLTDGTGGVPREVDCPGLHTYESQRAPGVQTSPNELAVFGTNGRRLIVRWAPEGVWVGGCLITEPEHADALAAFITRESDE